MTQAQQVGSGVPALSIRFAEESNIGLRKKEQQDYQGHLYIAPDEHLNAPLCVFMVCDGVSMGMAGALASRTAVELTLQSFTEFLKQGSEPLLALKAALETANAEVVRLEEERPGMATTCVASLLVGNQLYVAHVGDSRVYLARQGQALNLLTTDHSWTEEFGRTLVRQGVMSDDDLRRDGRRHSITRAMGLDANISFDFNQVTIQPYDRVLLCSDGLWDAVEAETLQQLVSEEQGNQNENILPVVAHNLINAALAAGGRDNITVSLLEIDEVGQPPKTVPLNALVAETRRNTQTRTGTLQDVAQDDVPTIQIKLPATPSFASQSEDTVETSPYSAETKAASPNSGDLSINQDSLFKKVQKLYALGEFDEAVVQMLELEQLCPQYTGLYEMMSNSLVRVIANAINRHDLGYATALIDDLEQANIVRYREMLFEFCMQESQEAEQARDYEIIHAYALLALHLHPSDNRPRHLEELSEAYLNFQNDKISLTEKLNLGQTIYARDPDFGGIQDDLALIYLELGDAAVQKGADNDALSWYQMVRGLRPRDARVYLLAVSKQRDLEDAMQRQVEQDSAQKELEYINAAAITPTPRPNSQIEAGVSQENKPDIEGINRLKERVSRTQKAWDNGRREVGGEYIYLVEQLNSILSPNPWQPTYPRVCYDYGKWLFEQHQYKEAKPFLEKARTLGVGAAQQKLREIERLEEEGEVGIGSGGSDNIITSGRISHAFENSLVRPAAQPDAAPERPATARITPNLSLRSPLITPYVEPPSEGNFVGASHAGDGVLGPASRSPIRPRSLPSAQELNLVSEVTPSIVEVGVADSGSDGEKPAEVHIEPVTNSPNHRDEKYLKPERLVGATGLRTPVNATSNKAIQNAVARELARLHSTGVPQYVAPKQAASRRASATLDLLRGVWLPVLLLLVVLAGITVVTFSFLNSKSQSNAQPTIENVAVTDNVSISPTPAPPTPTAVPTLPIIQPQIIISFAGANPSDYTMFLGLQSKGLKNLMLLTPGDNGSFNLSQADAAKLDRSEKYFVLARPKDTNTRKYLSDLPLDNPTQALYVQPQLDFDVAYNLKTNFNLGAQAINFYPLAGGDRDGDAQGGGHYYSSTHHIVRPDFLAYYQKTGEIGRWGFPISEEFDWNGTGHVQFFERGWLVKNADGTITPGAAGKVLLSTPCQIKTGPVLPPTNPQNPTTFATANSFSSFTTKNELGKPISEFFFQQVNGTNKLFQYFDNGRLELAQNDKNASIEPGIVGREFARCQNWSN